MFLEGHFGSSLEHGWEEAGADAAYPGWLLINVGLLPSKMRGCLCPGSTMARNRQLGLPDFFFSTELTSVVTVFLFCKRSEGERGRACPKRWTGRSGAVLPCPSDSVSFCPAQNISKCFAVVKKGLNSGLSLLFLKP